MKYLFATLLIILTFLSCSKNDSHCDPPPTNNGFEVGFTDNNGIPLLNNVYKKDSFKFWNTDKTLFLKLSRFGIGGDTSRLAINYSKIESGKDYWIELDTNVIDTLKFNFNHVERGEGECSYYKMLEVTYNGELHPNTNSSEGVFLFIKD